MNARLERREAAIDRMADYVLSQGLASATLRPLAAAAGTSDRMLLYYFADKDELLTAVLNRVAARLTQELDDAIPVGSPRPFAVLLDQVWTVLNSERQKPYMNVWLDLVSSAARGSELHREVAGLIADGYIAWVTRRLDGQPSDGAPSSAASLLLSTVSGLYLLTAIDRSGIADAAMLGLLTGTQLSQKGSPSRDP